MITKKEIFLWAILCSYLALSLGASTNPSGRLKHHEVEKRNSTHPFKEFAKIKEDKNPKKETEKSEPEANDKGGEADLSLNVVKKEATTLSPNTAEKSSLAHSSDAAVVATKAPMSEKANLYEDKFDEVQKVWQNLEARSRHHYEPYSWLGYETSLSPYQAIHHALPAPFVPDLNHARAFHHPSPFSVARFIPKRHVRNKKKASLGKKRKTVLVLHTPPTDNKNATDRVIKEDSEEIETNPINDGHIIEHVQSLKPRDLEALHPPMRFFDFPQYPWESPRIAFEEHYGANNLKHLNPADSFFKLADMMINKIKADSIFSDIGPYHTQTTRISATPDLVISATTNTKHGMDKMNELTPYGLNPTSGGDTTAYGTLEFTPPLQLSSHPAEPKKLLHLIENALDTMVLDHDNKEGDEEIEVHCPVHSRKSTSNDTQALGEHGGKKEVYEVCQCHFVKKNKDAEK